MRRHIGTPACASAPPPAHRHSRRALQPPPRCTPTQSTTWLLPGGDRERRPACVCTAPGLPAMHAVAPGARLLGCVVAAAGRPAMHAARHSDCTCLLHVCWCAAMQTTLPCLHDVTWQAIRDAMLRAHDVAEDCCLQRANATAAGFRLRAERPARLCADAGSGAEVEHSAMCHLASTATSRIAEPLHVSGRSDRT
eukprot:364959-Chlamydomonas_euryale.AAC.6